MMRSEPEEMLRPHPETMVEAGENRKMRRAREADLRKRNEDLVRENIRLRAALAKRVTGQ